jgi:hypothetical protein
MLIWLLTQVALGGPCADSCERQYESCASVSAAGCGIAGAAAEKATEKALGSIPGGALLSRGVGARAKAICEEKLAPCNNAKAVCLAACSEGTAASPAPAGSQSSAVGTPAPLLVFGEAGGASIWIDGMRAGVLPSSANEPYTSPPLLPGPHAVRVEDAQGRSWKKSITVTTGVINSVQVGALLSKGERRYAAALLIEKTGSRADALVAFAEVAASATDPKLADRALAAVDRIEASLEATRQESAQRHADVAENEWKQVLNLSADRWAQRNAAVSWLTLYDDTAHKEEATRLIAEIDGLIETHLATALSRIKHYETAVRPVYADRVEASRAVLKARNPARDAGLGRYLDRRVVESGVWADADARSSRYSLWRAEQKLHHTGRGWLIFASFSTAATLPFFVEAWDPESLRGLQLAVMGANVAAGAGLVATVETRHARMVGIYGSSFPKSGRLPGAGAPLITIGVLQLALFQKIKTAETEYYKGFQGSCDGEDCPTTEEWLDAIQDEDWEWEWARALNIVGLSGWLNVSMGVAALGLHYGGALGKGQVHLSPNGLRGTF